MAKTSFLLYTEFYQQIVKLSTEQKAELLDSIFLSALDREDEIKFTDLVTEIVFGFIKQQMDRNDEKFEEKKKRNAEYYARMKNKKNSENSDTENSENKIKKNSETEKRFKKNSENSDSDNENGNENENENDIINNNNISAHASSSPFPLTPSSIISEEEKASLVNDYGPDVIEDYINRVVNYCNEKHKTYCDYARTIRVWLGRDKVEKRVKSVDKYSSLINNF